MLLTRCAVKPPSNTTNVNHFQQVYYLSLDSAKLRGSDCASKSTIVASKLPVLVFALALAQASIAQSQISFEWVTIGDPGNQNDPLTDVPTGGVTPPPRGAVPSSTAFRSMKPQLAKIQRFS
jgi:hypothetical protein